MHRILAAACLAIACLCLQPSGAFAQSCAQLRAEHDMLVQRLIGGAMDQGSAMATAGRVQQLQQILPGCRDQQPGAQQPQQPQVGDYCQNGTTCPVGTRCARNGHQTCVAEGRDDCGNGTSCPAGSMCSRNGRMCIGADTVDCGAYTCGAGARCARDGKSCLKSDTVDCGGFHCGAGLKCGTGNQCLAQSAVDCGGGKSCPSGTVCLKGGAECITREQLAKRVDDEKKAKEETARREKEAKEAAEKARQEKIRLAREEAQKKAAAQKETTRLKEEERKKDIQRQKDEARAKAEKIAAEKALAARAKADRIAADKAAVQRTAAYRAAAAKAAAERIAAARAAGAARIQETRRNIDAIRVANASRALAFWNQARMRAVRPLPLPELPADPFKDLPIAPPPATPAPRGQNPDYAGGQAGSGIIDAVPLKWAGKLFFQTPGAQSVCSGQFIAPNIVLTAAHCVRDHATGGFFGNIIFALQFNDGHSSQRYSAACIATPDGWVRPTADRYRWDYALILTEQISLTGHFGWQVAWNGAHDRAHKVGYPVDIASGRIIQVDQGPLTVRGPIVEMRHSNPLHKQGSSGGAWVGRYSDAQGADENVALSVSSYIRSDAPGVAFGPYLDQEFERLLDYVKGGCQQAPQAAR